jgi:hypothetical protein
VISHFVTPEAQWQSQLSNDERCQGERRASVKITGTSPQTGTVVNSGDGTIQAAITALLTYRSFRPLPLLALLCGGTTNMTHQDLGLRAPQRAAADGRGIMGTVKPDSTENDPKVQSPLARIRSVFSGLAASLALFSPQIHRWASATGPSRSWRVFGRWLGGTMRWSPVSAGIRVDRSGMGSKDYLLVVTTLERLILGLRPSEIRRRTVNSRP